MLKVGLLAAPWSLDACPGGGGGEKAACFSAAWKEPQEKIYQKCLALSVLSPQGKKKKCEVQNTFNCKKKNNSGKNIKGVLAKW